MEKILKFLFGSDVAIINKIKSISENYTNAFSDTLSGDFLYVTIIIIVCTQIYPLIPILFKDNNGTKNLLKAKKEVRAKINAK